MAKEPPELKSGGEHPAEQTDEGTLSSSALPHDSAGESRTQAPRPETQGLLKPGDILKGQFEIIRTLGRGGMGVVYEARDRFLDERIALKTILPAHLSNKRAVRRFIEEINVARALNHANIIPVYDVAQDGGNLFFTMEFLEGDSLRRILQKRGCFDLEDTVRIVSQLADALIYAHEYIVHHDLSSDNVMVAEDGTVRLLDFGLARMKTRGTMTAAGATLGKAYYMAPEQAKDASKVDARADIFSLGVMVFEMLIGELPSGLQRLSGLCPELPPACDALLERCLAPVEKRFASAAEFKAALEKCLAAPAHELELAPDGRGEETEPASAHALRKTRQKPFTLITRIEAASPEWQAAAEGLQGFLHEQLSTQSDHKSEAKEADDQARRRRVTKRLKTRALSFGAAALGRMKQMLVARLTGRKARHPSTEAVPDAAPGRKRRKWAVAALGLAAAACVLGVILGAQFLRESGSRSPATESASEFVVPPSGGQQPAVPSSDASDPNRLKAALQTAVQPRETRTFSGIKMVWIPPGTFLMGSPSRKDRDKRQHRVTLTKGFWLGNTEVTKAQWKAVMGTEPWKGKSRYVLDDPDSPAVYMSWEDAQTFCKRAGNGFRLPTEAEWEYACRAGSRTAYCFGDSSSGLGTYGWYGGNADSKGEGYAHKVGQKKPNAWGLHDMCGNVWEWCQDRYGDYPRGSVTDPTGPWTGTYRVLRGGSWNDYPAACRSAARGRLTLVNRRTYGGFRVARTP